MKDFICIDIGSKFDKTDILKIFSKELSDFNWRTGESDAMGSYIAGTNSDGVQIQCWTDERPMEFSVSFRGVALDSKAKEQIIKHILYEVIPPVGNIVKLDM